MRIGFIGQGWIGRHYADDFERRGLSVVRYSLDAEHKHNSSALGKCDVVFIAVPTPTTVRGFDFSIVRKVLPLVGTGKIAVIKSTLLPGTTEKLQKLYPDRFVLHSPEFLVETNAAHDAAHPARNLVGIPRDTKLYRTKARKVLAVLPKAAYQKIMSARDAELVKYAGNCFLFTKVVYLNMLYDLVRASGGDWKTVRDAFVADGRIGTSHTEPVHKTGRGAGGHCFIKDFEAFRRMYENEVGDAAGDAFLAALRDKNLALLAKSGKDAELVAGVYGRSRKRNKKAAR